MPREGDETDLGSNACGVDLYERCIDGSVTDQEIFDTVAKHLAQQGGRALQPTGIGCAYRAQDGRRCAVGIFLEGDDALNFVGCVNSLRMKGLLPPGLGPHVSLLNHLQLTHDRAEGPKRDARPMALRLRHVAGTFNLSPAILETLTFPEVWT